MINTYTTRTLPIDTIIQNLTDLIKAADDIVTTYAPEVADDWDETIQPLTYWAHQLIDWRNAHPDA